MGYAGYVPAKIAEKKSPLQQALEAIPAADTLEVLYKLSYNTACQPTEDKYRTIKLGNSKINSTIVQVPGAIAILESFGWQSGTNEAGEAVLKLPKGTNVRAIQDAQAGFAKRQRDLKRSNSAKLLPETEEQRRLRQQLEADRKERALRGPVTEGSIAQALPGSGARIATAKDAGINTGGCDC